MRYLPLTDADRAQMLERIGAPSVDAFFEDVPQAARLDGPIGGLPFHQGEAEVEAWFRQRAARNLSAGESPFFCGAGAYRHHIPATVDHLIQRSEFLTSYTPYQPEISQGTLQTLFEFQTQVALITGMQIANASMYDGATSAAEAVLMACRITGRSKAILAGGLHPHYAAACRTVGDTRGVSFVTKTAAPPRHDESFYLEALDEETACIVVQTPNVFGELIDLRQLADAAHEKGALLIAVVTEIVSLGLIESPGAMGADIVAAEGQSLGVGLQFGGPHVGLLASRADRDYLRQMPGRLCGETTDIEGKRGFVLTLSTREQHIRRAKATSNICTNSGLMALAWTIHMTLLGEKGFTQLAALNHARALKAWERLGAVKGVERLNTSFFNEFALRLTRPAAEVVDELAHTGMIAGVPYSRLDPSAGLDDVLLVAVTETTSEDDIDALAQALQGVLA